MSQCQSIESLPSDVSLRRFHFNLIYNGAFFFERTRKGETLMTMDSIGAPRVSSFTKKLDKGNSTKGTRQRELDKGISTKGSRQRDLDKGNFTTVTEPGNLQKATMTTWPPQGNLQKETSTREPSKGNNDKATSKKEQWQGKLLQGKLLQRYYHIDLQGNFRKRTIAMWHW